MIYAGCGPRGGTSCPAPIVPVYVLIWNIITRVDRCLRSLVVQGFDGHGRRFVLSGIGMDEVVSCGWIWDERDVFRRRTNRQLKAKSQNVPAIQASMVWHS